MKYALAAWSRPRSTRESGKRAHEPPHATSQHPQRLLTWLPSQLACAHDSFLPSPTLFRRLRILCVPVPDSLHSIGYARAFTTPPCSMPAQNIPQMATTSPQLDIGPVTATTSLYFHNYRPIHIPPLFAASAMTFPYPPFPSTPIYLYAPMIYVQSIPLREPLAHTATSSPRATEHSAATSDVRSRGAWSRHLDRLGF